MSGANVLLGVSGSIAAYKACDIVRRLQDRGCAVRVVMTACAERFVTPMTFEALSRNPVARDMFVREAGWDMAHISCARWAQVYLIAPATANVIAKIAGGVADDLVTCTALATRAPIMIAPAMNSEMLSHALVQENIEKLKRHGVVFINPREGRLACGDVGAGALAEVDDIVAAVCALPASTA